MAHIAKFNVFSVIVRVLCKDELLGKFVSINLFHARTFLQLAVHVAPMRSEL